MRRVRVMGDLHDIPDDREYLIQAVEMVRPDRRVFYQYRFPVAPGTSVQVQRRTEDLLLGYVGSENANVAIPEWELLPPKHINEFLDYESEYEKHKNTGRLSAAELDEMYYKHGTMTGRVSDTMNVDFAEQEKRILGYMGPPGFKPKKKTKRSAKKKNSRWPSPGWIDDPIKEAAFGVMPSFEEELTVRPMYALDEEGEHMSSGKMRLPAGSRVTFRSPHTGEWETGTFVGRTPEMRGKTRDGCFLVATDTPSKYYSNNTKYTGKNHGAVLDVEQCGLREMDQAQWELVPEHIGVLARRGFIQDDVKIPEGATGRILSDMSRTNGRVKVSWNFPNPNFHSDIDANGVERHNIWEVPGSKVNLCFFDKITGRAKSIWPTGLGEQVEYKVGDLCKVSARSVSFVSKREREELVPGGTVVELTEDCGDRNRTWCCKIVGGCSDALVGETLKVRSNHMKPLADPDKFYRSGQTVEIVAEIDFRKKPLQGMKGKVILSTDSEGDVGIEFPDDIGAGSLDGIGREGHCIYIEASLVKSSE